MSDQLGQLPLIQDVHCPAVGGSHLLVQCLKGTEAIGGNDTSDDASVVRFPVTGDEPPAYQLVHQPSGSRRAFNESFSDLKGWKTARPSAPEYAEDVVLLDRDSVRLHDTPQEGSEAVCRPNQSHGGFLCAGTERDPLFDLALNRRRGGP